MVAAPVEPERLIFVDECGTHTEAYVEQVLAPSLSPGWVVVMDNLGAHKPKGVRELIEGQGCELVYLPAYSPDYNSVEIC
jgi:transposase